jgi:hypothetical protein
MVTVLLGPYGGGIQALTALLLVLFSLVLHTWAKPYDSNALNKLEMFALVVAGVTLVGGLYVVLEDLDQSSNTSSSGAELASVMVVGSNVILILVALIQLNRAIRQRFAATESRIQTFLESCATRCGGGERGRAIARRMSRVVIGERKKSVAEMRPNPLRMQHA